MSNPRNIVVVGGGAGGLAASVECARAGACVTVCESADRVGKSILATGDGRCNIGNVDARADVYRNADFVDRAFSACNVPHTRAFSRFFESLGLLLREEQGGRLYPATGKATSVVDVLRAEMARLGVVERCGDAVVSVRPTGDAWQVATQTGATIDADAVIVACGHALRAGLLPDRVAFKPLVPTLGPLKTDAQPLRGLNKVRAKCSITCNDAVEVGEVTFRDYGISGIAAFNMSRIVEAGDVIYLDFLFDYPYCTADDIFAARAASLKPQTWADFCRGMLLPLVAQAVLRCAGLHPDDPFDAACLDDFADAVRRFPLTVQGIGDARLCQVQRGGVSVDAVDASTLQVHHLPGLYVIGEALDIDAPCGGFNLHWAWISGLLAARAATKGSR